MAFLFKTFIFIILPAVFIYVGWLSYMWFKRTAPEKGSEERLLLDRMKDNNFLKDMDTFDPVLWEEVLNDRGSSIKDVLKGDDEITDIDLIIYSHKLNRK